MTLLATEDLEGNACLLPTSIVKTSQLPGAAVSRPPPPDAPAPQAKATSSTLPSAGGKPCAQSSGAEEPATKPPVRGCRAAPCLCLLFSGFNVFSAFLQVQIYKRFTPVYTETECGNQTAAMDRMSLSLDAISLGMQIEVTCTNPNPYGISILSSDPGATFIDLKDHRIGLGHLEVMPGSHLPEYGRGTIRVRMDTTVQGSEAHELFPHILSDKEVPIMMELQFHVGVGIAFGLARWSVEAPFKKSCGLLMSGVLVNQFIPADDPDTRTNRLGPLLCRESFDGLLEQLPPVGEKEETPKDGNMGFSAAQVAPQEVQAGEMLKTVSLGVSFALSVLSVVFGLLMSLACSGHRDSFVGVMAVCRGPWCTFSFSSLLMLAWNGALELTACVFAVFGVDAKGWRFPEDRLQPRPREVAGPGCFAVVSSWCSPLMGTCGRWRGLAMVEAGQGSGSTQGAARPSSFVGSFKSWFHLASVPAPAGGRTSAGFPVSGLPKSLSTSACVAPGVGAYSRLDMEGGTSPDHASAVVNRDATNIRKGDHPVRYHTSPLLAVSARRADMMEAAPWDRADHSSPRQLSRSGSRHKEVRTSSAAYKPDPPQHHSAPFGDPAPSPIYLSEGSERGSNFQRAQTFEDVR